MRVVRRATKIIRLVVVGVVALVILVLVSLGVVKKYADAPPSSTLAPYLVETSSRIYLGEKLSTVSGYPELTNYWYLQGSKYYFVKGFIDFPPIEYGQVEVVSRFNQ
jgi:hypothetical protein